MVKPPNFDKTFETFSHEVKDFYKSKRITVTIWVSFWVLNFSNVLTIIYSASPSWAWTQEVIGQDANSNQLEGEVYGFYGLWYTCFNDQHGPERFCLLWVTNDYMPSWFPAFQAMMTLTFILGVASFLFLSFFMFTRNLNRNLKMLKLYIFSIFSAVACATTGFIIFAVLFLQDAWWCCHPDLKREFIHYNLYWGFMLCGVGIGLYVMAGLGGIFEAMDILKERRIQTELDEWRRKESQMEFEMSRGAYDYGGGMQQPGYMNPILYGNNEGTWR